MRAVWTLVTLSLVMGLFAASCAARDPFLAELDAAPRVEGTDKTDVTHVVEKYIPKGARLNESLEFLKSRGFKDYPCTNCRVPEGQVWVIASREQRYKILFSEETRVIIHSDGRQILGVAAWIFLRGI